MQYYMGAAGAVYVLTSSHWAPDVDTVVHSADICLDSFVKALLVFKILLGKLNSFWCIAACWYESGMGLESLLNTGPKLTALILNNYRQISLDPSTLPCLLIKYFPVFSIFNIIFPKNEGREKTEFIEVSRKSNNQKS